MAFNPNPPKAEYQASAGQTNFPFLFKIYFTSDIKVYHTPISTGTTVLLTEGIDYSVLINGDDGGTVTLILVVENNDYIVLERELELTRYVEYQTSGDLLAGTLNADQDYQTYLVSDQNALRDNSLYLPNGIFGVDTEIPFPVAGYFFRWNSTGTAVEYGAPSTVTVPWGNISGTLSDQTDLAQALASKENALGLPNANGQVLASYTNGNRYWTNQTGVWGSITGTLSDQADLQTELDAKLPAVDPTYTGTLSGENIVATGTTQMQDRWVWQAGSASALDLYNTVNGTTKIGINHDAHKLAIHAVGCYYNNRRLAEEDAYATSTTGGTIKILVSGTDCYITTDGTTPGP